MFEHRARHLAPAYSLPSPISTCFGFKIYREVIKGQRDANTFADIQA